MGNYENLMQNKTQDTLVGRTNNWDFTVAYLSANTLTISNLPDEISVLNTEDIVAIIQYNSAWVRERSWYPENNTIEISGTTITVYQAGYDFQATDKFDVVTRISYQSAWVSWGGTSSSWATSWVAGAGITVGYEKGSYEFDASAQTITIDGLGTIKQEQIGVITNITKGEVIYSPTDASKGGTLAGNVLTLEYDTTSMSDGDTLGISLAYNVVTDYSLKADKVFEINPEQEQIYRPCDISYCTRFNSFWCWFR